MGRLDRQRTLVVKSVKPEDLPVIKMLIQNGLCKRASVAFVRDKEEALHGFVDRDNNGALQCILMPIPMNLQCAELKFC